MPPIIKDALRELQYVGIAGRAVVGGMVAWIPILVLRVASSA